jgi:hypothetical protein
MNRRVFNLLAQVCDVLGERNFRTEADGTHVHLQAAPRNALF